jgi:hypothetical protein
VVNRLRGISAGHNLFTQSTRSQNMYSKASFSDMKSFRFAYNAVCVVLLLGALLVLTSCELGQTVMVSKGEAGGFREIINGQAQYCKLTSTPDVTISDAAQEAFIKYCQDVE